MIRSYMSVIVYHTPEEVIVVRAWPGFARKEK